jgi:DMSO/TMAO reductase YedYZ molybdopterin-dependent catalytic subunit
LSDNEAKLVVLNDYHCYDVNGKPLPQKHGFPLRVIAEGYYGSTWAKYVDRIVFMDGHDEKE